MSIEPGITGTAKTKVSVDMTASKQGSGLVEGLATPVMILLMEEAAVRALEGQLAPGKTSVGTSVDIKHVAPTPVGMEVEASATLTKVEGHALTFTVSVDDERGLIGKGVHQRAVVDKASFAERIAARWEAVNASAVKEAL